MKNKNIKNVLEGLKKEDPIMVDKKDENITLNSLLESILQNFNIIMEILIKDKKYDSISVLSQNMANIYKEITNLNLTKRSALNEVLVQSKTIESNDNEIFLNNIMSNLQEKINDLKKNK